MKKSKFHYLLAIAAFGTAAVAAYFSVTGLGKLFAGASMSIMIMAGVLEFSKLVVASYVYRFWEKIKFLEKTYLIIALAILMTITSAGIYGYLSGAYSETSSKLQVSQGEISLLDKKKEQFKERIVNTEENISKKNIRITSLNNLRSTQESRLDSLYARKTYKQAKVVEGQIKDADVEIKKLTRETDSLLNVINVYNEEVSKLDLGATEKIAENLKGEAAPLQYIATLFGTTMDKVVNFFMFLLIFVCDPLAIILVIATNKVILSYEEDEKQDVEVKTISVEPVVEEPVVEEPIAEEPAVEEPIAEEPIVEEPVIEEPVAEEPIAEEPIVEEPVEEEPIVEISKESQKKADEVIQYMVDSKGDFKAVNNVDAEKEKIRKEIMDQVKAQGIGNNSIYMSFLEVLFKGGINQVGTILPVYSKFLEDLQFAGILYSNEKEVTDFLTICNLFKITDMSGPDKRIAKEYAVAKEIISLLSK
jgi:hypothetical protein